MRLALQSSRVSQAVLLGIILFISGLETRLAGQSTYTAQFTGVVTAAANGQHIASGANLDRNSASVYNASCFADPGDQIVGNASRYFSNLRDDGIHNADLSITKEFIICEGMRLQVRGKFFNFMNTPRFNFPNTSFGDSAVGQVTRTLNTPRHTQIGLRFEF